MKINYEDRIQKVSDERAVMLSAVKENIINNNSNLLNNLNDIINALNIDDMNIKKYNSIIKSKQLIFELTEKIVDADSVAEIGALRKKINYYIKKIKKELMDRNVVQEEIDKMHDNVDYLRYDITRYIRFLKRNSNLTKISNFYENLSSLSLDDSKEFKKLLSNEVRYNKRYTDSVNSYPSKKVRPTNLEQAATLPISSYDKSFDIDLIEEELNTDEDNATTGVVLDSLSEETNQETLIELIETNKESDSSLDNAVEFPLNVTAPIDKKDSYDLLMREYDLSFLKKQIESFLSKYPFARLKSYKGNFISRCSALLHNIPRYSFNKKVIQDAEYDYNVYYNGEDLGSFIDYFKKNNSIQLAIELIFKKSKLSQKEIEYLFNHEKCVDWIVEFCNLQSYDLDNEKKLIKP